MGNSVSSSTLRSLEITLAVTGSVALLGLFLVFFSRRCYARKGQMLKFDEETPTPRPSRTLSVSRFLSPGTRLVFPQRRNLGTRHSGSLVPDRLDSLNSSRTPGQQRLSVRSLVPTSIAPQTSSPARPPLAVVNRTSSQLSSRGSSVYASATHIPTATTAVEDPCDMHPIAEYVPPTPSSFDDDDGMSVNTTSTLPPSYRTRRSVLDLDQYPVPPLPANSGLHGPRPPPSAYTRGHSNSERSPSAMAHLSHAAGLRETTDHDRRWTAPAGEEETAVRLNIQPGSRRRSQDGGIRLEGGREGLSRSGTRPPPYEKSG
ncbi:hypothetical protein K466DRAFT_238455 [Polyporus arcularius HHB13444]|uniref:Uncharacterized protein n=1 Tax=Polyporus arcularius HHB13444 TaxID=1314778 RepID=A0A5C3P322_9APHY|nr:hypothetical protein K466DRAFT_238455 [Polyporus arcularius HHB13444]